MAASSSSSGDYVLIEGWADKESRHFGFWRKRWLVLFSDHKTQLPMLCTFEQERSRWGGELPAATEVIRLAGATCMSCPPGVARGRENAFVLHTRQRDFFFAAPDAVDCKRWVRTISQGIATAALRLGGIGHTPDDFSYSSSPEGPGTPAGAARPAAAAGTPTSAAGAAAGLSVYAADPWVGASERPSGVAEDAAPPGLADSTRRSFSEEAAEAVAKAGLRVPAVLQQQQAQAEAEAGRDRLSDAELGDAVAPLEASVSVSRQSSSKRASADSPSLSRGSREALEEQNKQLLSYIAKLHGTLDVVALGELQAQLDELQARELEAREELSAAEEAAHTAKEAAAEAKRGSPGGDDGLLPDRHRTSSIDSALPDSIDGEEEEGPGEEVAEAEAEVAEVEGRLAQLELQQHVLADLIHQIQARQPPPPPPGALRPSASVASVQSSCSEADDSGYVPFSG